MNDKMRSMGRIAIAIALLSPASGAQFPGDVFFTDPNPIVIEGQEVTLTVEIFTGTQDFGAIGSMLHFDPVEFELLSVRGLSGAQLTATTEQRAVAGGHAFGVWNTGSLTGPFGSIELIEIRGRPLVARGQSVQLTLVPADVLEPDGTPFTTFDGLSARIDVVTARVFASAAQAAGVRRLAGPIVPGIDPFFADVPLRRAGHLIPLWQFEQERGVLLWRQRPWQTFDPRAPSD